MSTPPLFDPNEFAQWLIEGFQEVLRYRVRQTLDRDRWMELFKARIPNKNQVVHLALKRAFLKAGFGFEDLELGHTRIHLIRKTWRKPKPGALIRRVVFVPGLGDSPGSWLPMFLMSQKELSVHFDEILVIDFPGYMGFLSNHEMISSMSVLLDSVRTICDSNPPAVLIGHSLGGWLAAKTAQEMGRWMDQLILIAPSGLIPPVERKTFGDFIVKNRELDLAALLELIVHEPKRFKAILNQDFKDFYSKDSVRQFVESVRDDQFIDPKVPFKAERLAVIWGDRDRFVPTHWMRHWVESYGEILDAYLLHHTGHIPQMERPYVTSRVLVHSLMDQGGVQGRGWKKIQSRRRESRLGSEKWNGRGLLKGPGQT